MLFVPLIGGVVKGRVSLQNLDREHAFSEADVRLFSTLANSECRLLGKCISFNETEQRNAELLQCSVYKKACCRNGYARHL
jgi:hypothetical protein